MGGRCLRVGAGVGHGQEEGLVVGQLEVLITELLAVDGLSTGALHLLACIFLDMRYAQRTLHDVHCHG